MRQTYGYEATMSEDEEKEERVQQAYKEWKQSDTTYRELEAKYGIPHATLQRWFTKFGKDATKNIETRENVEDKEPPKAFTDQSIGEEASRVFELLEAGETLPRIVIQLEMEPHRVEDLYHHWLEIRRIDVNQPPVLKQVKEVNDYVCEIHVDLINHKNSNTHRSMESLLEHAANIGTYKVQNCRHVNEDGYCTWWQWTDQYGRGVWKKADPVRCAFCTIF